MVVRLGIFTDSNFYHDSKGRYFTQTNLRRTLISEYARKFDSIRIFCRCSQRNLEDVPSSEIIDIPNISFTHLPAFKGFRGFMRHRKQIIQQIREDIKSCDVCYLRAPAQICSIGSKIARSLGIPAVCHTIGDGSAVFGLDETIFRSKLLRRLVSLFVFYRQRYDTNLCDDQIAISKMLAEKFCKNPERVHIILNTSLVQESFLPFRSRRPDEPLNALFVGRLVHHKNIQLFLHALAELRKQGLPVKTTIVGEGNYLPVLQSITRDLGIADVVYFTGNIDSRKDLLERYSQAHFLYLLSLTEGLGVVLLEAGAASLPIIGSRRGGIPEIAREGENAFLIEPDDVHGCAEAVKRLLDDESLREKMGRRSQEIMRPYTVKETVERISEVIRELLRGK